MLLVLSHSSIFFWNSGETAAICSGIIDSLPSTSANNKCKTKSSIILLKNQLGYILKDHSK